MDLGVTEPAATLLVPGGQQRRQQVVVVGVVPAVVVDQLLGGVVQVLEVAGVAAVARGGQAAHRAGQEHLPEEAVEHGVEGPLDALGELRADRGRVEGPAHRAQGHPVQLLEGVDDHAVLPARRGLLDLGLHGDRVAFQLGALEGRLHESALPPVVAERAGDQAVAGDVAGPVVEDPALVEDPVVGQHLPEQLGMGGHVRGGRTDIDPHQVAVGRQ